MTLGRRGFLAGLKARGLHAIEFVVSDDHPGLEKALAELPSEAARQRCYAHFLGNALDHVPRRIDDECPHELRCLYHRRDLAEARRDLAQRLAKCKTKHPKLMAWVDDNRYLNRELSKDHKREMMRQAA